MDYSKRKKMYIFGSAGAALLIVVIILCVALSSCGSGKYDKYYDQAETAFLQRDYDAALDSLEKAMDIRPTEECYLLMAEIYYVQDDIDMAIQVLYLGYSRVGGDNIDRRLEELKDLKNGGGEDDGGSVTIAGKEYDLNAGSLVLSGKGLTNSDLEALGGFENLESLSLSSNGLSDISALSGLTGLTFLQLSDNGISDISALSGMSKLKTLYIDGNPISDFSPLYSLSSLRTLSMKEISISTQQLKELLDALPNCSIFSEVEDMPEEITLGGKTFMSDVTELNLGGLGITDISQLSKCKNLVKLDLRDNNISDIAPLVDLQQLEWLCLWNNQVEDIRPLMSLTQLKYIDADSNRIKDISVIEYLTGLEELWLSGNELDGIKSLAALEQLRRLGLKNTGLEDGDLDVLSGLGSLKELTIEENEALTANRVDELKRQLPDCTVAHSELLYAVKFGSQEFKSDAEEISAVSCGVSDISGLEKFTKLKTLVLTGNGISDLSPLKDIMSLEALELYGNKISDLSALKNHTALRSLSLLNNNITDISPLGSCTGLKELHLSYNSISDVGALRNCTALEDLDLDGNLLTDISGLSTLVNLKNLSLENNAISDLTPLYTLSSLQTLYIRGNELDAQEVRDLQFALPNCAVITDVDLSEDTEVIGDGETETVE